MDELLRDFVEETAKLLEGAHSGSGGTDGAPDFGELLRLLHTVKGTCGFLGLDRLQALAHAGEDLAGRCARQTPPPQAATLIAQTMGRIGLLVHEIAAAGAEPTGNDDDLIFHLGALAGRSWPNYGNGHGYAPPSPPKSRPEPVTRIRNPEFERLQTFAGDLVASCEQLEATIPSMTGAWVESLTKLMAALRELQESVSAGRLRPIAEAWRNIPAIVGDLSERLGKPITFEVDGGETPIDEAMLGTINQALVHMVRNCADHGLESPDERAAANKERTGRITIRACAAGRDVRIEIADDGCGLDTPEIAAAALRSGKVSASELLAMDEDRIHQLVFEAGLSTAPEITSVSGRGIGMDIVRASIAKLGGRLAIASAAGAGTRITITLPQLLGAETTASPEGPAASIRSTPQAQSPKRIAA